MDVLLIIMKALVVDEGDMVTLLRGVFPACRTLGRAAMGTVKRVRVVLFVGENAGDGLRWAASARPDLHLELHQQQQVERSQQPCAAAMLRDVHARVGTLSGVRHVVLHGLRCDSHRVGSSLALLTPNVRSLMVRGGNLAISGRPDDVRAQIMVSTPVSVAPRAILQAVPELEDLKLVCVTLADESYLGRRLVCRSSPSLTHPSLCSLTLSLHGRGMVWPSWEPALQVIHDCKRLRALHAMVRDDAGTSDEMCQDVRPPPWLDLILPTPSWRRRRVDASGGVSILRLNIPQWILIDVEVDAILTGAPELQELMALDLDLDTDHHHQACQWQRLRFGGLCVGCGYDKLARLPLGSLTQPLEVSTPGHIVVPSSEEKIVALQRVSSALESCGGTQCLSSLDREKCISLISAGDNIVLNSSLMSFAPLLSIYGKPESRVKPESLELVGAWDVYTLVHDGALASVLDTRHIRTLHLVGCEAVLSTLVRSMPELQRVYNSG